MKLKLVKVGDVEYAEVKNGKPLYVKDDGSEVEGDLPHAIGKIAELGSERQTWRDKAETAERALEAFKGLDPAKAKEALSLVASIDQSKLLDAGKVEQLKTEIKTGYETQIGELKTAHKTESDGLRKKLADQAKGHAFMGSGYAKERIQGGPHAALALLGHRFDLVDDVLVALGQDGKPIPSIKRPGSPMDIEEALPVLVAELPFRKDIEKGVGANGGGAQEAARVADGKAMSQQQFEALDQASRSKFISGGGVVSPA